MKLRHLLYFSGFGISTILFRRKDPIVGTIIVTDKCNLSCRHCSVNNILAQIYPYREIRREMETLYQMGIRILFFCGGETFLWHDQGKNLRDLVREAKAMGFYLVNVVTNGTYPIDLPEADLILLSMDGDREAHNWIRGDTFDTICQHIRQATKDNICLYMAINRYNQHTVGTVCDFARQEQNVRAVSFNFHTPYPDTQALALTRAEKAAVCQLLSQRISAGDPIFNLKTAFPYLVDNTFSVPCHQCVVMEQGKLTTCGRCLEVPGLCSQCGYFFAAEYSLVFSGNVKVIWDMLHTYLKFI